MEEVRWGVLGASAFARSCFVPAMLRATNVKVLGVASRSPERAWQFTRDLELPFAYRDYQRLLDDVAIEAVYIPLANGLHYEWALRAAEAGKHVLVEKPLALNARQAFTLTAEFHRRKLRLGEALMYRYAPRTQQLKKLAGQVGPLRRIHAAFHHLLTDHGNIRFDPEQGGGALYDLGCYTVNICRFLAGTEPERLSARLYRRQGTAVDDEGEARLEFPGGLVATIEFGFNAGWHERVDVSGARGHLAVDGCFTGAGVPQVIYVNREGPAGHDQEVVEGEQLDSLGLYTLTGWRFSQVIRGVSPPLLPPEDAIANLRVMDAIRHSAAEGGAEVTL